MNPKILVVDDVLPDIDQVRAQALALQYGEVTSVGVKYPGINFADMQQEMKDKLGPVVANLMRCTIVPKITFFRLAVEAHRPEIYIHADGQGEAKWAAILYLTPEEDCVGGTAFWQHRETGLRALPEDQDHLAQKFIDDGKDESLWQMTDLISMRYNRLLIFRSNQFHARYPEQFPFQDQTNGRLTFVMFYDLQ